MESLDLSVKNFSLIEITETLLYWSTFYLDVTDASDLKPGAEQTFFFFSKQRKDEQSGQPD